jgi:hypothetical protein
LAVNRLQQGGNAARVLGTNPVELETVGHQQRDLGKIFGHLGYQGLDPGVELLLWQVLGQLLYAGLPQALAGVSAGLAVGAAMGSSVISGGILVVDRRNGSRRRIVACQGVIHNFKSTCKKQGGGTWVCGFLWVDKGPQRGGHCQLASSLR